jgi:hypothetical protein
MDKLRNAAISVFIACMGGLILWALAEAVRMTLKAHCSG